MEGGGAAEALGELAGVAPRHLVLPGAAVAGVCGADQGGRGGLVQGECRVTRGAAAAWCRHLQGVPENWPPLNFSKCWNLLPHFPKFF